MRILAVDPGLDAAAAALFDPSLIPARRDSRDLDGRLTAAHTFVRSLICRTDSGDRLSSRLAKLHCWAFGLAGELPETVVHVEIPPTWHAGKEMKGRVQPAKMMAAVHGLNRALGALLSGFELGGATVVEVPASKMRKEQRIELANHFLRLAGHQEVRNKDAADAAWYGIEAVVEAAGLARGAFARR